MTYLEIEAFLEVIKSGSISAAAESLFVSQPALSRRIAALEEELGYTLIQRKKGQRTIELTDKGNAFIQIAKNWMSIWQDARELSHLDKTQILNISSVGSVSTYLLPTVFHEFATNHSDIRICFHNYHSYEAYQYVNNSTVDIAFISDDMYHKSVETIPAFREPMVLIANQSRHYPDIVHPTMLNPEFEIRLPWNPEFDMWHNYWFKPLNHYKMFLDQMSLLEFCLLWKDTWAIVPASVAYRLSQFTYIRTYHLESGPPDRIIYYLRGNNKKQPLVTELLSILNMELSMIPSIESFL